MVFPHPLCANEEGVLAMGGDLLADRLITAYAFGIFPWYTEGQPILWWYPNDRFIIPLDCLKLPKSMRTYFNNKVFTASVNLAFDQVIHRCQNIPRRGQPGTWITDDMKAAYIDLNSKGYAHSVEVWQDDKLVGGLYGVATGLIFSGESMFSEVSNASKFGAIAWFSYLYKLGFKWIDCQQYSRHMELLGGHTIEGRDYFKMLRKNLGKTLPKIPKIPEIPTDIS